VRPALASAGLVSGSPLLCALGEVTTETLLLVGADAAERCNALRARESRPEPSRLFPDGGVAVMRTGWAKDASVLVMDAGPHGAMNCGHAHADALAFDLTVRGTPLFVDPGTLTYTTDPESRNRFRASASHNCATVDGADSSTMAGPFSWTSKTDARIERWSASLLGDFVSARHDGFGPPCARQVLRIPSPGGDVWIVRDCFEADREHLFEAHFQCAAGVSTEVLQGDRVRLLSGNEALADLIGFGGEFTVEDGKVSSLYGRWDPAPHLRFGCRSRGRTVLCTIIAPSSTGLGNVRYSKTGGSSCLAWSAEAVDYMAIIADGTAVNWGGVTVDARAFWATRDFGDGPIRWWRSVGARRVSIGSQVAVDSPEPCDTSGGATSPAGNGD
jgi:hypothetical protein